MSKQRILINGFINTNVLDGSAIFLSSITQVVAMHPDAEIDLLLAVPFKRDVVLKDLMTLPNVRIIDPFAEEAYSDFPFFKKGGMTPREAALMLDFTFQQLHYDIVIIRSLEVVQELVRMDSRVISKLFAYITGITSHTTAIPEVTQHLLNDIIAKGGKLLCQTNEMKRYICQSVQIEASDIIYLNPMIPDNPYTFQQLFTAKEIYSSFCYTGKFAREWNIVPIVAQFREVTEQYPDATLYFAGDYFKNDVDHPSFVHEAGYLLRNTENLKWLGGLNRDESMDLIRFSDVGISYRAADLDDSLELSTKLLEYCSMAVPPILNRTEMHEAIFGIDYPYYANDDRTFHEQMIKVIENPALYEATAEKVYAISKQFSFTATYHRLAPHLFGAANNRTEEIERQVLIQEQPVYNESAGLYAFPLNGHDDLYIQQAAQLGRLKSVSMRNDVALCQIQPGEQNAVKDIIAVVKELSQHTALDHSMKSVDDIERLIIYKTEQNQVKAAPRRKAAAPANIEAENLKLKKSLSDVQRKYNSLSSSKLGGLQKKYWQMRNNRKKKKLQKNK
ncbi:glycosyltransferase family 1 protein [Macrococcus hajekii]|uniref:Glycosyltransferase family 1 protein n=1 Tax=Macrococcus hajekii TaxID=198482 RepID=A0A4R6BNT8_9STAP|nr:glycosyltransferase family 1 protein [Macrococcus hajekii]TDM03382.1 glycosyltransferase family 1 protein [Macrococcus hajekii]GGA98387.1 hypothetical protein GCM10007190_03010 [Macrococcus hajekii]